MGKPGFPIPQSLLGAAGAPTGRGAVRQAHRRWGNPVSPYVHLRPHARGAQLREGEWGNPVSPTPNRCWERLAPPSAGVRFDRLTAGGETRFPRMFTSGPMRGAHNSGRGNGETRFPQPPTAVGSGWRPHRQGCGSTGSPQVRYGAGPRGGWCRDERGEHTLTNGQRINECQSIHMQARMFVLAYSFLIH